MATNKSTACDGCGKKRKLVPIKESKLCKECQSIAEVLQSNPEQIEHIASLMKLGLKFEDDMETAQDMPEVLDAVRYRTSDRERNTWYVSVSELKGEPVEIFASTAFDRDDQLQSRISNLTTITRLISLILRHIFLHEKLTLEKTTKQLHRSSRQPNDLPDMLGQVLQNYSIPKQNTADTDDMGSI